MRAVKNLDSKRIFIAFSELFGLILILFGLKALIEVQNSEETTVLSEFIPKVGDNELLIFAAGTIISGILIIVLSSTAWKFLNQKSFYVEFTTGSAAVLSFFLGLDILLLGVLVFLWDADTIDYEWLEDYFIETIEDISFLTIQSISILMIFSGGALIALASKLLQKDNMTFSTITISFEIIFLSLAILYEII